MIIEAVKIGIIAWVFSHILMGSGMIFESWWKVLNRLPSWIAMPLGRCEYCLAGQMALWYFIFSHQYNVFHHIAYISIALITVKTLNRLLHGTETN